MKVLILAGGFGTRIAELSSLIPKPMISIAKKPLLFHIIKSYSLYGYSKFIILTGYKSSIITDYFMENKAYHKNIFGKNFSVNLFYTGIKTQTGGRIYKARKYLDDSFFLTYGDGLSNVDIDKLKKNHLKSKCMVTLTAVQPRARFGALQIKNNRVKKFSEKFVNQNSWINGGYFVINKEIFKLHFSNESSFEFDILPQIVKKNSLNSFKHKGFWHPCDTLGDKNYLENIALQYKSKLPWHEKY